MKPIYPHLRPVIGLAAAILSTAATSQGALLVHESFAGYTPGILNGKAVNGAVGLSGTWGGNTASATAGNVISGGLSFGSLVTSGGAYQTVTGTVVVGASISTASPYTGKLWSSQLVRFDGDHSFAAANNGVEIRIGDSVDGASNTRFRTFPDSRLTGYIEIGIDLNSGDSANIGTSGPPALAKDTTYIMISSFENVGGTAGTSATAYTWALTLTQFEAMIASEMGAEAYLTGATVGSGQVSAIATETENTKGTDTFTSGDFLQLVNVGNNVTLDELRFGSLLGDVIPVPEPATAALAMLGGLVLLRRKRTGRAD